MDAESPQFRDSQILDNTAETISGYDETAARFAARWGELRLERALHAFASRVPGQRRVLELGCGPGRDIDFLSQLGCQVVGLDLSAGMLVQARKRLPDACLVRADLCRLPFARGRFDGIWACASLLHLRRAQFPTVLGEIAWLLHPPGGVLYLALKGGQGERWVVDGDGRRYFFAYYQPSEIETALSDAGFQVVESWVASDESGRAEPWLNFVATSETG